jgi:hypothetical protein
MSALPETKAAIEAKFLRHVYDPNCDDCAVDEYPCADHRQACTNCGGEATIAGQLHRTKADRRGNSIRIWWCTACDKAAESGEGYDLVDGIRVPR